MEYFYSGQRLIIARLVPHTPLKRGDVVHFVMRQKSPGIGFVYAVARGNETYLLVKEDFESYGGSEE